MTSRRTFLLTTLSCAGTAAAAPPARKPAPPRPLREDDPHAVAVGYVEDAARVDRKRYPKFTPDQDCARCDLYKAPVDAPWGPCTVFPGQLVAGRGWCDVFVTRR
ncbi:MAG: high-potential iron-sulfur protein [Rhizobacter sp.]|jgi:hypothetical protein